MVVNSWKPMAIFTKRSILDVATVLGPPLKAVDSVSRSLVASQITKL